MQRAVVIAVALAGAAVGLSPGTAAASTGPATLTAELSGGVEVPPGDPDGRGSAQVTVRQSQVCVTLTVQGVAPVTAGHIHRGAAGTAGPVVVPLIDNPEGLPTEQAFSSEQICRDADAALLKEMRDDPGSFYVNLHNAEFPGGAVRGQLAGAQLPFTGAGAGELALLGLGLAAAGGALVVAGRRRPVAD